MHQDAVCFADQAWHGAAEVIENVRLARDTYRLRIECPEIARRIVPGQFVMVRLAGCDDPLLGRPLALYDIYHSPAGEPQGIDLVYLVIGRMTRRFSLLQPGQQTEVWGPLGNGFPAANVDHLILVAGGIGQTPFPAVAQQYLGHRQYGDPPRTSPQALPWAGRVTLCYGVRTAEYLAGVEDFEKRGVEVKIATDDGSAGHHGLVTDLLKQALDGSPAATSVASPASSNRTAVRILCCGPEKMMEAVAQLALARDIPCDVSLETPMACGIGICFSCVAKVRQEDGGWDYRRTCVEGPVFAASSLAWD